MAGDSDELLGVLRRVRRLILSHPLAAQALYAALMGEGRRFAATASGQAWAERLRKSQLVLQGAAAWESLTLNILEDDESAILPSALVDAFVQATQRSDLEALLRQLLTPDAEPRAAVDRETVDRETVDRETVGRGNAAP
jgi:hypothetical protein